VGIAGTASAAFVSFDVGTSIVMNVSGYTLTARRAFNYTLTQPTLSADITPASLTVAGITGDNKVYDQDDGGHLQRLAFAEWRFQRRCRQRHPRRLADGVVLRLQYRHEQDHHVSGYTLSGTRARFNYILDAAHSPDG
jgi:hypothetical protein